MFTQLNKRHIAENISFSKGKFSHVHFPLFFFLFNTVSQHPREITTLLSYPYIFNSLKIYWK